MPQFKVLRDDILAYEFVYPVATQSGRPLPVLLSRAPERYSSAAPMTADARQRIVCQLADLKDAITISVTVCGGAAPGNAATHTTSTHAMSTTTHVTSTTHTHPFVAYQVGPPSGVLKGIDTAAWQPKDVANTVLIDKSTARVTTGQRVSLSSLESVQSVQKGNTTYIVYEHVSQGSPRPGNTAYETYRHAYSVSATRPGLDGTPYIYSLSLACPEELWGELQVPFMTAVNSFTLVEPSSAYVAPDKDPWRFF